MDLVKLVVILHRDDCTIIHRFIPIIGPVNIPYYDDELKLNPSLAEYDISDLMLAYVAETIGIVYKTYAVVIQELRRQGLMLVVNVEHMGMITATVMDVPKHAPEAERGWILSFLSESGESGDRVFMPAKLEQFFERPVWKLLDPHFDAFPIVKIYSKDQLRLVPDDSDVIVQWSKKCAECAADMAYHNAKPKCKSCTANAIAATLLADIENEQCTRQRAVEAKAAKVRAAKAKADAKKIRDAPFTILCERSQLEALGFVL